MIDNGEIYFGGLPKHYQTAKGAIATNAYFVGCITDVTLNEEIINFASHVERQSGVIDICPDGILGKFSKISFIFKRSKTIFLNFTDYEPSSVKLYYPFDESPTIFEDTSSKKEEHKVEDIHNRFGGDVEEETEKPEETTMPPTTTTTPKPTTTTTKRPLPEESECKLPPKPTYDVDFASGGYRFLGLADSRVEISTQKNVFRKKYDVSLEFRTNHPSGLIFFVDTEKHIDYIALYILDGNLYHQSRVGNTNFSLISDKTYNDGEWHTVQISRKDNIATIIVDDEDIQDTKLEKQPSRPFVMNLPVYVGGIPHGFEDEANAQTHLVKGTYFNGCIREIKVNKTLVVSEINPYGSVIPCSDEVENGYFFEQGYIKVFESFNVGEEMSLQFDMRSRALNGTLFSVIQTKNRYMILELVNGVLTFVVKTDDHNIVRTNYTLLNDESFCDGKWRSIQAVKSKFVITLTVDNISTQPDVGTQGSMNTKTGRPLFMGGHKAMPRMPIFQSRRGFLGCIRNVQYNNKRVNINHESVYGKVMPGICPIN